MLVSASAVALIGLSRNERSRLTKIFGDLKDKLKEWNHFVNWLIHKIHRVVFIQTPIGEVWSILYGLYLHLRFSFNDRSPGKDRAKLKYYLTKHCHIVEKGLALPAPSAGFGQPKIIDLIEKTRLYESLHGKDTMTKVVRDTVREYISFHEKNQHALPREFLSLILEFAEEEESVGKGGLKTLEKKMWGSYSLETFKHFLTCRHSVRDFSNTPIRDETIQQIVHVALNTPSVCNRQGWMIHYYNNEAEIKTLLGYQNGNAGFTDCIHRLLIVTGNIKAFTRYEHNQLFVDGGLLSMNIMLALHSAGLGSCPLNTCMPSYKEELLKKAAKIPMNEKLIMMIAVGGLKDTFRVAQSEKYELEHVLKAH
jgi:nitroreductase